MPKFTLFWLTVYFGGMFGSFFNPLYGLLAYLFEYYLRPRLHWWGSPQYLPDWRWNLMIASVAILTFVMRRGSLREMPRALEPRAQVVRGVRLQHGRGVHVVGPPEKAGRRHRTLPSCCCSTASSSATSAARGCFDAFMGVHIAGAGWWGWQAYIDPRREGGRLMNIGSSDTLNDNLAAAHLLTVLPILCVYALTAKDKRLRALALITAPFIVNTFILCNSRGATVGLAVGIAGGSASSRARASRADVRGCAGRGRAVLRACRPDLHRSAEDHRRRRCRD